MTPASRIVIGLGLSVVLPAGAGAGEPDRLFREQVAPILERRCLHCHGGETAKGGLSLASRGGLLRGGENGPAVVPGKPDESLLIEMVSGDAPEMPQKDGPLSAEQVDGLRRWVEQGAHWPEGLALKDRRFDGRDVVGVPAADAAAGARRHGDRGWVRTPVDAFILARLEAEGLRPARGRPPHPDPPAHLRPARPAADARGDRRVPRTTRSPTPTSGWSTACSPRRATASAGAGTGSTSSTTATRTATTRTSAATTPGPIATT